MDHNRKIEISDCTLLEASANLELSFREKIELCRLMDKLDVSSINLPPIRQKKVDSLLVKSISSAVRNATIALPVALNDPDSVSLAWESLKEAPAARLQVVAPVSSVQMEYLLHLKPDAMIRAVSEAVRACRAWTDEVEFIAEDATRSDPEFLHRMIREAIESGVKRVTLCDTAGNMMPEEVTAFFEETCGNVPGLKECRVGFCSTGDLNMADACAFAAILAGASEVKVTAGKGKSISLENIVRIIDLKGKAAEVTCAIGAEQIRRITARVAAICSAAGRKNVPMEEDTLPAGADIALNAHDSLETVIHAAEQLGYDLNAEDQQKVWKHFRQTVERKEQITLKELDAIIAAEAMQVPPAYSNIQYVINTGNQIGAMAHMKLELHHRPLEGIASGDGAIDAAFNSIEQATGRHFELDEFRIQAVTEGREAMGETVVRLRHEGKLFSGRGISTDIVGAGIMAYINAMNKIVYEEEEE